MSTIIIRKIKEKQDIFQIVDEIIDLFIQKKKIQEVFIKPNLCYYWDSSSGETTSLTLIEAIIKSLDHRFKPNTIYIVESDATSMKTKYSFKILGYEKLAKKFDNLHLLNLIETDQINIKIDNTSKIPDRIVKKLKLPKMIIERDKELSLFISVPKIKTHPITVISCALKNQFGCIGYRRKIIFHKYLDIILPLINYLINPDLIIVDGIISKIGSNTKKLDVVLGSNDPVAIDAYIARNLNVNPMKLKYIKKSLEMNYGDINYEIYGDKIKWPSYSYKKYLLSEYMKLIYNFVISNFTIEGRYFNMGKGGNF